MKVYVAGRTTDTLNVQFVQSMVRERGGEITLDWTNVEGGIKPDWYHFPGDAQNIAEAEREAVKECDLLILCLAADGVGMYIETGMAMAQEKHVIVYGPDGRDSVFWYLPRVEQVFSREELGVCLDEFFDAEA